LEIIQAVAHRPKCRLVVPAVDGDGAARPSDGGGLLSQRNDLAALEQPDGSAATRTSDGLYGHEMIQIDKQAQTGGDLLPISQVGPIVAKDVAGSEAVS
jgi:hypothetical protein